MTYFIEIYKHGDGSIKCSACIWPIDHLEGFLKVSLATGCITIAIFKIKAK